jgi:hypothetical protein
MEGFFMRYAKFSAVLIGFGLVLTAQAQFIQPWNFQAPSFRSRVKDCPSTLPSPIAAYDDFVSTSTTVLNVVIWWGNVNSPAQLNRRYLIAIYDNIPGACMPDLAAGPKYRACVVPALTAPVGVDCNGNQVHVFGSFLPGGFPVAAGQQYWLQISESDIHSVTVGVDNFRWSGHMPTNGCRALQIDAFGNIIAPLTGCGAINDLAFALF